MADPDLLELAALSAQLGSEEAARRELAERQQRLADDQARNLTITIGPRGVTIPRHTVTSLIEYERLYGPVEQWKPFDWCHVAISLAMRLQKAEAPRKPGRRASTKLPQTGIGEQSEKQIARLVWQADELIEANEAQRSEARESGKPMPKKLQRRQAIRQVVLCSLARDRDFAATARGREAGFQTVGDHRLTGKALDTLAKRDRAFRRKMRTKPT